MTSFQALSMSPKQWRSLTWFFQNSSRVKDVSSMTLKHLVKTAFVYSFLKLQNTCWPMGCMKKRCHVGEEECDFYKAILCARITQQGWRVYWGTVHHKAPFRQLAFTKRILNSGCKDLMHPSMKCLDTQAFALALHVTDSLTLFTFCSLNA